MEKIIIFSFWALAVLSLKNIPSSLAVFIALIPSIWIFKISPSSIIKIALTSILFTAYFIGTQQPVTAEIFAEIAYLLIGTQVIIRFKENE